MKRKGLKVVTVLLAVVMLMSGFLIGCGDKGETKTAESTQSTQPATESTAEPTPSAPQIKGDFEIALFTNGDGSPYDVLYKEMIAEFKKMYPEVNVIPTLGPKIYDITKTRFAAGNPVDITVNGAAVSSSDINAGYVLDLTDWLQTAEAIGYDGLLKDNFSASGLIVDGKQYTLPTSGYRWGVYYNKKMAADNGWNPPANWQEFLELAPKIKEKGIYPITQQGIYPDYVFNSLMETGLASMAGSQLLVDLANLKPEAFKDANYLEMFKRLKFMQDQDWMPKTAIGITHTEAQINFLQGKSFMIPSGDWLEMEMQKDTPEGFEFGFIPSFFHDSGKVASFIPSFEQIYIAKDGKNPEAAKEFLRLFYSKQFVRRFAELVSSTRLMKNENYEGIKLPPSLLDGVKAVSEGKAQLVVANGPGFDNYAKLNAERNAAIQGMLGGKMTPEQAIEKIGKVAAEVAADTSIVKVEVKK